jgi:hypothetical protein
MAKNAFVAHAGYLRQRGKFKPAFTLSSLATLFM